MRFMFEFCFDSTGDVLYDYTSIVDNSMRCRASKIRVQIKVKIEKLRLWATKIMAIWIGTRHILMFGFGRHRRRFIK
jgi:hypothetical protein